MTDIITMTNYDRYIFLIKDYKTKIYHTINHNNNHKSFRLLSKIVKNN